MARQQRSTLLTLLLCALHGMGHAQPLHEAAGARVLLPARSTWRYWGSGPLPAQDVATWASTAFDDSAWGSGQGPLGFDDAAAAAGHVTGLATELQGGKGASGARPNTVWVPVQRLCCVLLKSHPCPSSCTTPPTATPPPLANPRGLSDD